jgi:hypothetical protein
MALSNAERQQLWRNKKGGCKMTLKLHPTEVHALLWVLRLEGLTELHDKISHQMKPSGERSSD